jgi:hypothetical protein
VRRALILLYLAWTVEDLPFTITGRCSTPEQAA